MNNIEERTAATTIQRVVRGRAVRKNINKIQALKNQGYECPITNQSIIRFNARLIRCGHVFQAKALETWMTTKGPTASCPTCRAKISIVSTTNSNGGTLLHEAAEKGHEETVQLLIEGGANVKAADNHGVTPLLLAAKSGNIDTH